MVDIPGFILTAIIVSLALLFYCWVKEKLGLMWFNRKWHKIWKKEWEKKNPNATISFEEWCKKETFDKKSREKS